MGVVFVDESGCPGFDFRRVKGKGSSEMLVLAGVYFQTRTDYRAWCKLHKEWLRKRREFKFDEATGGARTSYGNMAMRARWGWHALICHKEQMRNRDFDPEGLYRMVAEFMLGNIAKKIRAGHDAVFDRRTFRGTTKALFDQMALGELETAAPWARGGEKREAVFKTTRYVNSEESPGVQLADFVAGACSARWKTWTDREPQWHQIVDRKGWPQVWPGVPSETE